MVRQGFLKFAAVALLLAAALPCPAGAQTLPATLRVETFDVPPLMMEQEGKPTGFAVEIWEEIAARLGVKTAYQAASEVAGAFDALRSGKADVIVLSTLTKERDKEFDFSYPTLEAGLEIMVRETGETATPNPLQDLLALLVSKTTLTWFAGALLFMVVSAHLVWLLERRRKDGMFAGSGYFAGILQAMFWSGSTLLSQAEQNPRQPLARVFTFVWMFIGIVFVALYTAQLTANITVEQIRGTINGPDDLPGKRVGSIKGTPSVDWLREHNAKVQEFTRLPELYQALTSGKIEAVLFAAPPLRYFAAHEGKGLVRLVGPEFAKRDGGIVFRDGSPLRRPVDNALVSMEEDGTYQRIYEKWFGRD